MAHARIRSVLQIPSAPSREFLITLNVLLFVGTGVLTSSSIGYVFLIPLTILFAALSGVWQLIWYAIEIRIKLYQVVRCVGYLLPYTLLMAISVLGIIPPKPNQQYPSTSPSGLYRAYVTSDFNFWSVEIHGVDGEMQHKEETEFISSFSIYWLWDEQDTFWIYNSDDGSVHYWQMKTKDVWKHIDWTEQRDKQNQDVLSNPPSELFQSLNSR